MSGKSTTHFHSPFPDINLTPTMASQTNHSSPVELSSLTSASSTGNDVVDHPKVATGMDNHNNNHDDDVSKEVVDAQQDEEECVLSQGIMCICCSCDEQRKELVKKRSQKIMLAKKRKVAANEMMSGTVVSATSKSDNGKTEGDDFGLDYVMVNSDNGGKKRQRPAAAAAYSLQSSASQQYCQAITSTSQSSDHEQSIKLNKMTTACRTILECIGEDPNREGLLKTPERWAKALLFMTRGYSLSPEKVLNNAIFTEDSHKEIVVVKNIDIHSKCEHHMVPFTGQIHVGYIPNGKIIGLSKIARIAEVYSRRLQVQERLTRQIVDAIVEHVEPLGVGVVVECSHFCMVMRGVQKVGAKTVTSCVRGCFESNMKTRAEFFNIINGGMSR